MALTTTLDPAAFRLAGIDFTSAPRRAKPITWAWGRQPAPGLVRLEQLEALPSADAFASMLATPGPWLGAFDFPFGLPRELVETLGWPAHSWTASMDHVATLDRPALVEAFSAFCDARPVGGKFAHRAGDSAAGCSPSMKWVNPPVAFMLHAGVPALRAAGVRVPGLSDGGLGTGTGSGIGSGSGSGTGIGTGSGVSAVTTAGDPARVALEGYPGLVARELIGRRSYKSDTRAQQTPERLIARKDLVDALEQGRWRGLRLKLTHGQRDALVDDAQGDRLDAVLCLMLAAWAQYRPGYGLPDFDPLEGWIVGAER